MTVNSNGQLEQRALLDLTNRAKGGIYIYLGVWLIIGISYDLYLTVPVYFYLNTAILGIFMASRLAHLIILKRRPDISTEFMTRWLVYTVLVATFHWGVVVGWGLGMEETGNIRYLLLIVTAALGIGGASALSISGQIRVFYPSLMFFGPTVVSLYQGGIENWVLATLLVFTLIYVYSTSAIIHSDYWASIRNQLIAEERAVILEELSTTDQLTQLKNRMYFDTKFDEEWQRGTRIGTPLSILMLDLDHFKSINDDYGHVFGDECLKKVANVLNQTLNRRSDCVARYGGEEFVVLLPGTDAEELKYIAEKTLKDIANIEISFNARPVQVTCSIGGSTNIPATEERGEDLLKLADAALYSAKNNGRNRYCASPARLQKSRLG